MFVFVTLFLVVDDSMEVSVGRQSYLVGTFDGSTFKIVSDFK